MAACKQKPENASSANAFNVTDAPPIVRLDVNKIKAGQAEYRNQEIKDSITAKKMLYKILGFAKAKIDKPSFSKIIRVDGDDVYTFAQMGNIFSTNKKHLFVRRVVKPTAVYINVFLIDNKNFRNVLSFKEWPMVYIGDTIKDVNGDKLNDFLFNWYGSSGCCARNAYDIYVYNKDTGDFTDKINFINPTFSTSEKVVRGVEYGHPGEVPLYKFKWVGADVDTIEYIYPADTIKKKFYLVKRHKDVNNPEKRKIITTIPAEYRKIADYDWFIDY